MHGPAVRALQDVDVLRQGQPLSLVRFMSAGGMRPAFFLLCRTKPNLEPFNFEYQVRLFRAALAAHGHALADDILRPADATATSVSAFVLASRFVAITANLAGVGAVNFRGFPQEVVF